MKDGLIVDDGSPVEMISVKRISSLFNMPAEVVRERQPHIHEDYRIHERES
jgi:hypothetical protein